jgi:MerR family copper efflux transcriptional regulator
MGQLLTIGKVARLADVTPDTIRYYERVGLLPRASRTAAGYRQYLGDVVHRLAVIRTAQKFGFSLTEIAGFLKVRESGGKPCGEVRAAAQRMLLAVDRQIIDLKATRRRMLATLRLWDQKLTVTPDNKPAHLLEALTSTRLGNRSARSTKLRRHRYPLENTAPKQ